MWDPPSEQAEWRNVPGTDTSRPTLRGERAPAYLGLWRKHVRQRVCGKTDGERRGRDWEGEINQNFTFLPPPSPS